jgi:hypothetical protein
VITTVIQNQAVTLWEALLKWVAEHRLEPQTQQKRNQVGGLMEMVRVQRNGMLLRKLPVLKITKMTLIKK